MKTKLESLNLCLQLIQLRRKVNFDTFGKLTVKFDHTKECIDVFENDRSNAAYQMDTIAEIVKACPRLHFVMTYKNEEFKYHIF